MHCISLVVLFQAAWHWILFLLSLKWTLFAFFFSTMMTHQLFASHALCFFHHSTAKITNPRTPIVFIQLSTSPLPTLHSPAFTCCSSSGLGVWAWYYSNHTEGQSRGEEGEMLTHKWRAGASSWYCSLLLAVNTLKLCPPYCVMVLIISAAKPVTAAAAGAARSQCLYLSIYWVIVRDAVVHVENQSCHWARNVTKEKTTFVIWPCEDETRAEDRAAGAEEEKLIRRYKRMGAWEDRSWHVCWRFGVTEWKTERSKNRRHRLRENCKSQLAHIAETVKI